MAKVFTILSCLGSGPLGTVYKCQHLKIPDQIFAVKTFLPDLFTDEPARKAVKNSFFKICSINQKNLLRLYEYFYNDGIVSISMKYVDGPTLADLLAENTNHDLHRATSILLGVLRGLSALHEAGITVHNIKAENILIADDDTPLLSDYYLGEYFDYLKFQGAISASIDNVAPEILDSQTPSKASDLYSLGCIAYEIVTGEMPFAGNSLIDTMQQRLESTPVPPAVKKSGCPTSLSDWILTLLSRKPEDRFPSASIALEKLSQISIDTLN